MSTQLDFSSELKEKTEKFNENYEKLISEYLTKQGNAKPQQQNQDGRLVVPEAVCVFKTFDTQGGKIFINMCSHKDINAPKEENILEMDNQYGVRIPMSLSEKAEDFDNSGKPCAVYDVIFNPKVTDQGMKDPEVMKFALTVVCERIMQRFNHRIDFSQFRIMKNIKYKGKSVRSQMVRIVKKHIEEVIKPQNVNSFSDNALTPEVYKEQVPDWKIFMNLSANKSLRIEELIHLIESKGDFKITAKHFSNFGIPSLGIEADDTEDLGIIPYTTYGVNSKSCSEVIIQISLPLLAKGFGIKLRIVDKHKLTMYLPKLYVLNLNLYHLPSAFIVTNAYFNKTSRSLYVFLKNTSKSLDLSVPNKESININEDYLFELVE